MSAYTDELFKRVREGIGLQNPAMIAGTVRSDLMALEGYIAGMERGIDMREPGLVQKALVSPADRTAKIAEALAKLGVEPKS